MYQESIRTISQKRSNVRTRVKNKIIAFLKQGMTPRELALAVAIGLVLGTFPVIGATTLLCIAASFALRLNLPAMQSVNWIASPLQLILLIPLFNLGGTLFGVGHVAVSLGDLIGMMKTDLPGTIREFLVVTLRAVCAWSLVAPVAAGLVYFLVLPLFTRLHREFIRLRVEPEPVRYNDIP
jgi:uncharacterized protein (DUF2062 family)